MRIAHVTATFPPDYSGTGVICQHNAVGLARLGHEVHVFTTAPPGQPPGIGVEDGVAVHRLPVLLRLGNAPWLPGLCRLNGFDLVHLHYPFYFGAEMVGWQALRRNLRYVVTYHQDVLFAGLLRFPERLHHRLLGERILSRSARVLATSWDYARASRLAHWLQMAPGHVEELPNGVDAARFAPHVDGRAVRTRYGLAEGERVVLFVGALDRAHYFKGVDVLLHAVAQLPDPRVRLWLVGDGDLRSTHQREAAELGLAERVTFCGRVADAELPAYYACADLLVLPSITMGEAFGVVLLEAMACGKPVIASNLPGVRSVVSDGEDGLLVRPGDVADLRDKISALLADPQRRRAMGQRGRAKVEQRYDWPVIIPRLARVYQEVLAN